MPNASHEQIFQKAIRFAESDPRVQGLDLHRRGNDFSELVIATTPDSYPSVAKQLREVAASFGNLLLAYEPVLHTTARELTCLFDEPVGQMDIRALPLGTLPLSHSTILWERNDALTQALRGQREAGPHLDLQWMEDRFWVWLQGAGNSLREGALFEALHALDGLRSQILVPLLLLKAGRDPDRMMDLEKCGCPELSSLRATIPLYDAKSCELSLREAAKLYVGLRETLAPSTLERHGRAELAVMRFLHTVNTTLPQ